MPTPKRSRGTSILIARLTPTAPDRGDAMTEPKPEHDSLTALFRFPQLRVQGRPILSAPDCDSDACVGSRELCESGGLRVVVDSRWFGESLACT